MRTTSIALVALLAGCPKPAPAPTATAEAPPIDIACPAGLKPSGASPPNGYEAWCLHVDSTGQVWKQGPTVLWHPEGNKSTLGQYEKDKKHGYWQSWYPNGDLASQGSYDHGVAVGVWTEFHGADAKKSEGSMENGAPSGQWTYWHPNGQIHTQGTMLNGEREGTWIEHDELGTPRVERDYREGRLISHREL